ncbi:2-oxoacid:acceptor oxidoreductase family protein [Phosphitispora fastidiosa]|uniref:2-oxoacid:acceptor oxidoreductase family protein n=1 Tax=Phosphitispora fastidiosa TaxID=2837202 RepID=UPI001E5BFAFE|nr:2-oxoacid:acceptor oxidoreductase family protein [Phosphitispora fastidiosa]MBU7007686.1 2-oxoglutarate ferredoxin oxidoreductase subunit gamma [Phosphitispora fastidiosa]
MLEELIIAGFGGQGVMSMGQLITYAGMIENKNVAWIPSYGPEMRGGTANCAVTVSDREISSPVVTEPSTVIIMNQPSLKKFLPLLKPGGLLLINSSLVTADIPRDDLRVLEIPSNELANEKLDNTRVANIIILGAYIEITKVVTIDSIVESLKKVLPERRHNLIPLNRQAMELGAEFAKQANI